VILALQMFDGNARPVANPSARAGQSIKQRGLPAIRISRQSYGELLHFASIQSRNDKAETRRCENKT